MNEAIKLAIEKGGYKGAVPGDGQRVNLNIIRPYGVATALKMWNSYILQDPLFWQALGNALGWVFRSDTPEAWKKEALRFFELKLTGGDEEKFWEELLRKETK